MKSVWLLKSSEGSDGRYKDALTKAGFSAVVVPTLSFQWCNEAPLRDALQRPQDHTGIIFTSQRAVEAVAQIYEKLAVSIHDQWSDKKVFVIGEATQMAVQTLLKLPSIGQESGNAKQLAPIIIRETKPFDKPLLYPCGNLGRDELPRLLAQQDRDFRALTTYQTSSHPDLRQTVQKLTMAGQMPDVAVFFSPSGVKFALPVFEELKVSTTGVKIVAIGPTTNTALVEHHQSVWGVCPLPSPDGLTRVLAALQ
ncbi:uroporphyrinogen-III synthase-like [Portunus trituberculatus]|uniref:Uroporphyrinogen-III synthase n=1 Tax=Portunus trituberculatus TaxID=210409 RepID=A0A5B7HCF8_PORTR|nr:uroporphyrinogen-III synthase-like [Portunus trituberculatus]XP_045130757.1 uroporphyrinogen-III synthase-like [Portunus trituberculatus]MPC66638.1 Uroporphyrinogen-III synthase [Portunus trituberculatus]